MLVDKLNNKTATDYTNYDRWKKWSPEQFLSTTTREARYYQGEFSDVEISGRQLLEIGFGNGSFLGWARSKGAHCSGTEILPTALSAARDAGIPLLDSELSKNLPQHFGQFDGIVAFDVLEHLTIEQNLALLDDVGALLKPGGFFLARFPNGQSPLGRVWQHGDHTHRSTLSALIFQQLLIGKNTKLVRAGNPYRERWGGPMKRAGLVVRYLCQDIVAKATHFIFDFDAPLALNTVVMARREQ